MTKRATKYFKAKKELKEWLINEAVENYIERYYERNLGERELDDYLESWYDSPSIYNSPSMYSNAEIIQNVASYPLDKDFIK